MSDVAAMGMSLWLTLLPLCLAFYRVVIYDALVSPLARIPAAHWSAHFSPVWILMIRYYGRENREVHAAHCRSGAVVRLGPNEISVNSLECVKSVYVGGWEKSAWYSVFTNYWGCAFHSQHFLNLVESSLYRIIF